MKKIILTALTFAIFAAPLYAEGFKAGDSVNSSSAESNEAVERVKRQITELNKGIIHGAPQFSLVGKVEKVGEQYFINGDAFVINSNTIIHGDFKSDSFVEARGYLVKGKVKVARVVTVAAPQPANPSSASSDKPLPEK